MILHRGFEWLTYSVKVEGGRRFNTHMAANTTIGNLRSQSLRHPATLHLMTR
jgi:hypothetical protein